MLQVGVLQHHFVVLYFEPTHHAIRYLRVAVILAVSTRTVTQLLYCYVQKALGVIFYLQVVAGADVLITIIEATQDYEVAVAGQHHSGQIRQLALYGVVAQVLDDSPLVNSPVINLDQTWTHYFWSQMVLNASELQDISVPEGLRCMVA